MVSFDEIVGDCLKNIAGNIRIDDLLPLALVSTKCKNLFFGIFEKTTTLFHTIKFRELIVSLKLFDYLSIHDRCELYIPPASGKNLIISDFI